MKHTAPWMRLCLAAMLFLFTGWGSNCALEQEGTPCCLKPDHSTDVMTRGACLAAKGMALSKDSCGNKDKILQGLCQRFVGFCFQANGSCYTDWKDKLKASPPWYDVNVCLQENIAGGAFNCIKGRQCFEKLVQGAAAVTIKGDDGSSFSTGVKVQSTSQTVELTVTLTEKRVLLITVHSNPIQAKEYTLAKNNTQGATLTYTDKSGTQHTSYSGRLLITKLEKNKATGTFTFLNKQNRTYEGKLIAAPTR